MSTPYTAAELELIRRYHVWLLAIGKMMHFTRDILRYHPCYAGYVEYAPVFHTYSAITGQFAKYQDSDGYQSKVITVNSNISILVNKHLDDIDPKPVPDHLVAFIVSQVADLLAIEIRASSYKAFYDTEHGQIYERVQSYWKDTDKLVDSIEQHYFDYIGCDVMDKDVDRTIRVVIDQCFYDIRRALGTMGLSLASDIVSPHAKLYSKEELTRIILQRADGRKISPNCTCTGPLYA